MIKTDICIIGAGPGGVATALRLAQLNIQCVLIDKAVFPRDKICGDGLTGRTVAILNRINPEIINTLGAQPYATDSWGVEFKMDDKKSFPVPFRKNFTKGKDIAPCYVSRRMDFDNHLVAFARKEKLITFIEGVGIDTHNFENGVWIVSDKTKTHVFECKILIVANGPLSSFVRHTLNVKADPKHQAAAVRAYYKNVGGCHTDNFIELHFLKDYLPGYFWIFPLPNGDANVGFGMLSSTISQKKINLKHGLEDIIANRPGIKERFANATLDGEVVGFPLPMGSKRHQLSGDSYMLVGDAASLVDPLTGEGIGNAVFSGFIAAEQAQKCLEINNFSAEFLKDYDTRIWRVMGTELNLSYRMQKLGKFPAVFNAILWMASRNVQVSEIVYSMFNNIDIRKRILNPVFWMKMLVNAK